MPWKPVDDHVTFVVKTLNHLSEFKICDRMCPDYTNVYNPVQTKLGKLEKTTTTHVKIILVVGTNNLWVVGQQMW